MVERPVADVVHDAVESLGNSEAALYLKVGARKQQKRSGKHVVRVKAAAVGECVFGNLHGQSNQPSSFLYECY